MLGKKKGREKQKGGEKEGEQRMKRMKMMKKKEKEEKGSHYLGGQNKK